MEQHETEFLLSLLRELSLPGPHLEIGTAAGGTLWRMMDVFHVRHRPRFVVVDPLEYFPSQSEVLQTNLRLHNIEPSQVDIRATTSERAFDAAHSSKERFDFIIIDGRHGHLDVLRDLRWTSLLNVGGVVCLHDHAERFPGVRWAANRFLQREADRFVMLGQAGSLLALRKVSHSSGFAFSDWALATVLTSRRRLSRRWARAAGRSVEGARVLNSEHSYQTSYVRRETERLLSGFVHSTLSPLATDDGAGDFQALIRLGLGPHHRVVDYGCGSLRLGRHLIGYLHSGHYWGLDITDTFFRGASAQWRNSDKARCSVMSATILREVSEWRPHIVLVAGVLQCVPTPMLVTTMRRLSSMCTERTQVLLTLLESEESIQLGPFAFRHSIGDVADAAKSAGLALEVLAAGSEPRRLRGELQASRGQRATVILLAKTPSAFRSGSLPHERLQEFRYPASADTPPTPDKTEVGSERVLKP